MATFSDFNTSLTSHPINKDVSLKNDVEAVKQSIKNIILTDKLERPFQPTIGCDVKKFIRKLYTTNCNDGKISHSRSSRTI